MNTRRFVRDIPATPHFDFLYGRYHLSSWIIPYFSTIMPLKHTAQSLRLAADFPGSEDIKWKLDELYQREVDWPRVERRILPYLRASDQPQFFNSLTIALLPMRRDLSETSYAFGSDGAWKPPTLSDESRFAKTVTVGPISCGFWTGWEKFSQAEARTGQIRWNPEQVFAVALDGQHRLAAMQEFVKNPGISDDHLDDTCVPVIFVVLEPDFGYMARGQAALVDVLRKVFIDLNKHAKTPSRTRQILLDDKDPTSVCVRALVGDALCAGTAELEATPCRLPLSLVDWHTEQAKFDDGPYVTTVLVLDWAIANLLGAKPIQDFTDYPAIRKQVNALSQSLAIDLKLTLRRLKDLESIQMKPFDYSEDPANDELGRIAGAFQRVWNPVFVRLLTEFTPYRDVIEIRQQQDSFTLEFLNWYRLRYQYRRDHYAGRATKDYQRFVGRMSVRSNPIGEGQLEGMLDGIERRKRRNLAFNVVFQRSYFLAFDQFRQVKDLDLGELEDFDDDDIFDDDDDNGDKPAIAEGASEDVVEDEEPIEMLAEHMAMRAEQFVTAMNALLRAVPDILDHDYLFESSDGDQQRFWLGTLRKADGGIDFTQGASQRGQEIVFWVVAMQTYDEIVGPDEHSDFEDFWAAVLDRTTSFSRRVARSVGRFSDKEGSAGSRILDARSEDFEQQASREEARQRMNWLWSRLEL